MELKQETQTVAVVRGEVLIVPLWNWNKVNQQKNGTHARLNRTFMELKQC